MEEITAQEFFVNKPPGSICLITDAILKSSSYGIDYY